MWLLPVLDRLASFATRSYYHFETDGRRVPSEGPVMIVANHPNSLMDPALVAAAAGRPVRFLAKAPLFRDPVIGWLVRAAGSIPVHRAQDDPSALGRNEDTFRDVHAALRAGSAVAIFPEGISHDFPALATMKTGAARIALGAASQIGPFPIVPVGLSFRAKERFRSDALARVGPPIDWAELAEGEPGPKEVRELTRRIEAALRSLTLNLASWEDAPLVRSAAEIHAARYGAAARTPAAFAAEREAGRLLALARETGTAEWESTARDVRRHAAILEGLGLRASDLGSRTGTRTATTWTLRQLGFLAVHGAAGTLGSIVFYPPYRLTGEIVARLHLAQDLRATYRVLGGAMLFAVWIIGLAAIAGWIGGAAAAVAALLLLPPLAVYTRRFHDRWSRVRETVRRWLLLRPRERLRTRLMVRQDRLAERLESLRAEVDDARTAADRDGRDGGALTA
jgi:glycerol-3-phosphate O-acyltransferase / dihydroxyacetone phosphate acyltransferase